MRHLYIMRVYYSLTREEGVWTQYATFGVNNNFAQRFNVDTPIISRALSHLEEIILGYQGESGALLYVNDDVDFIRTIARLILARGRQSLLLTYFPEDIKPNEFYSAIGKEYPIA